MEYAISDSSVVEHILSINVFKKQERLEGVDSKINQFLNLLMMKKGTISRNPDDGIDVESFVHRLNDLNTRNELLARIEDQIGKYIDDFNVSVDISETTEIGDVSIMLTIINTGEEITINLDYDNDKLSISIPKKDFER